MIELSYHFLHWFKRHHFIYIFGFLVNLKPINSFLYELFVTAKNVTEQQYNEDIYPVSAYTTAVTAIVIFFIISFCVFNLIFVVTCVGGVALSVFIWQGTTLTELQVTQGFSGCVVATEAIYFASIYVCHDIKKDFAPQTAYIRAVPLLARMISAVLSQLVVTNTWMDYQELAFLSVPAMAHTILLMWHLPPMYDLHEPPDGFSPKFSWFRSKFKETFSDTHVLKWSLWSAFTLCGFMRVSATMQPLWRKAQLESIEAPYNGAVDAITAFLSLLAVLLSGTLKAIFKHEKLFLCVTSVLQSALLFCAANVNNVWDCTIFFIIFEIFYHFGMSVVSTMIARNVYRTGSFGLVFGFIGLIYSIMNLIFVVVINKQVISLTILEEIMVYGGYHLVIAIFVAYLWLIKL